MKWIDLKESAQLDTIDNQSKNAPVIIFKHSTRCSISKVALNRMESGTTELGVDCYYLDLLKHRDISNQIAEHYQVEHQSPQILIIRNGQCQYSDTHMNITFEDVKKELVELA